MRGNEVGREREGVKCFLVYVIETLNLHNQLIIILSKGIFGLSKKF